MKTPLLGDKAFYRQATAIGLPIALQNLLTTSGSMVDTMMIGSQGELAVAAVGICSQYAASLLVSAIFGFFNGGTIFYAQYWGVKNEKGISRSFGLTTSCMLGITLLFALAAILIPEQILSIYTDKESIRQIAAPYLRLLGFAMPLQILSMALSGLLRSTGQVRVPLYASIASLITNTSLNWMLIYGHCGLPAMGVVGAAAATLASSLVNAVLLISYCFYDKQRPFLRISWEHLCWSRDFMRQYFGKSLPIAANEIFMGIGFMIINIVVGRQNEMAIAAMAVFRVIEGIVFSFFRGFTNASAVMVGSQIGAGNHLKGYTQAKQFALLCPLVVFGICILQVIFRESLLGIFGLGPQALEYGRQMLVIFVVAATMRTCNWICNDSFRAGGESMFGTVVEIVCMYLFTVPTMILSGLVLHLPFAAVFICVYMDDYIRFFLVIWYMNSGKWVKPITPEGEKALPAFRALLASKKRPAKAEENC
ncbi:MAG: MATE family efflux transporter [Provencibacterium sp.]|jgi:putative MATE family efflux protein|nr:MATE family efflux transporter [Provencibacterium sp.]